MEQHFHKIRKEGGRPRKCATLAVLLFLGLLRVGVLFAQEAGHRNTEKDTDQERDDVIRVSTDLIETGVSVFEKNGKFRDGLKAGDFELRVDGRPQPVSFFERVGARTTEEDEALNRRRGSETSPLSPASGRGRVVLFFIDDLHLSAESVARTRKMLLSFIERDMRPDDQALIASASGQVGFLQQLTGDKDVLRAAIERLKLRQSPALDTDRPPMTPYQALLVEQDERSVIDHFVAFLISTEFASFQRAGNVTLARSLAEQAVKSRASRILKQYESTNTFTLSALENLTRSSAALPGRKLIVFASDGFLINARDSDVIRKLQRITDAAVRTGAVVYAVQASGLNTSFPDAASDVFLGTEDRDTGRAPLGEDTAMQAPLTALAADTGGRALLNSNDLSGLARALRETDDYYLLAWRPDPELFKEKRFHQIEVIVKGRPKLIVRVHKGFISDPSSDTARASQRSKEESAKTADQVLVSAINTMAQRGTLPTYVTVNYLDQPGSGPALNIFMQVTTDQPQTEKGDSAQSIDVAGVIYDDRGKLAASFQGRLKSQSVSAGATDPNRKALVYYDQVKVKPGLYQVRVAASNGERGTVGTAALWITVPDLNSGRLSLSSLLIGERKKADGEAPVNSSSPGKAQLKIDGRFTQESRLRFLVYIYNASRSTARKIPPQVEVQVDVLHNDRVVFSIPLQRASATDDPAGIPFAEEFSLSVLGHGRFLIRLTATDRVSKSIVTREAAFEIN